MLINIIAWIVLGAIAGYVAGRIMKTGSGSLVRNLIVGIVGAFVGGFLANLVGLGGDGAFSIMGLITAIVGAVVLLFVLNLVQSGKNKVTG